MASTINPKNFVVTLTATVDGSPGPQHTLSGWSESDTVVTMPDIEYYANIVRGLDGIQVGTIDGTFGGDVTFEFMSNSASVEWFQDRVAEMRQTKNVELNGQIVNNNTGERVSLRRGLLFSGRSAPSLGSRVQPMTFTVRFEDLPTDYTNFVGEVAASG